MALALVSRTCVYRNVELGRSGVVRQDGALAITPVNRINWQGACLRDACGRSFKMRTFGLAFNTVSELKRVTQRLFHLAERRVTRCRLGERKYLTTHTSTSQSSAAFGSRYDAQITKQPMSQSFDSWLGVGLAHMFANNATNNVGLQ
jgi:hypothetical protein